MKCRFAVYLLALTVLCCLGCGGGGDADRHADRAHGGGEWLTLNDGEKWEMDDHTRGMIAEINATLASADISDAAGARALGDSLQAQVNQLVRGCTMKGPAHDQLHVFLARFIPAVGGLVTTGDMESARETLADIRSMLADYGRTFR